MLIEAAQQDASRFAELYELHFERVYAYIARRVRERSAVEELTSQVFHQALLNIGIGNSMIEMGEAHGNAQPMPPALYTYVADLEETYQRALNAGATSLLPPKDQGYGDRTAWVKDAWGNIWYLAAPMALMLVPAEVALRRHGIGRRADLSHFK